MITIKNKFSIFFSFSLFSYLLLIGSFYVRVIDRIEENKNSFVTQADLHYQDIINTRSWNAGLGGVYAYPRDYKPNPYLKNNTIKDANGTMMIKINPAWMTRMLSEYSKNQDYHFSLKSNTPRNPINKAEGFYAESLKEISQMKSTVNVTKYHFIEKTQKFEYIQGLYLEQACMSCHQESHDVIDGLRGGVAIEINANYYFNYLTNIWNEFYIISIVITVLIVLLNILVYKFLRRVDEIEILNRTLEDKVKEKTRELHNALAGSHLGYWSWNIQTNEYKVDEIWRFILGLIEDEHIFTIEDIQKLIYPEDLSYVKSTVEEAIANRKAYVIEFRMQHKDGTYIWIESSGSIISYDKESQPLELSGTHQDISKRKNLEDEVTHNNLYLNTLFDKNPNIIIITDGEKMLKTNQAFFKIFYEYSSLEMFLEKFNCIYELFVTGADTNFITNVKHLWIEEIFQKEQPIAKIIYKSKTYYFAVQAKKIFEQNSTSFIVTFSDITETYILKKEYQRLAITDGLTGLYNRRYFNQIFTQELNRALRNNHSLTLLIIDIDNFKLYNDNYGHDKGDAVLQKLSKQLQLCSKRSNEFVFRIGGEEFGILYSEFSKENSLLHAQAICKSVEDLKIEHKYSKPLDVVTMSVGHYYAQNVQSLKVETIYHNADQALYFAKQNGRNRVADYDAMLAHHE